MEEIGKMLTEDLKRVGETDAEGNIVLKGAMDTVKVGRPIEPPVKNNIKLPSLGKLISTFAQEVSSELKNKNTLFFRPNSMEIVEIGKIKCHDTDEDVYTGFLSIKPNRFITFVEKYFEPGIEVWNPLYKTFEFRKKSMGRELATTLLHSSILQESLPGINRIFTIPLPIIYKGELTFPKKGYDKRFGSWLSHDSPEIENPEMSVEEAKLLLLSIFKEFCFQSKQDYTNAIAALLTPFLRGLFPSFSTRTPVFFYLANRERAGKDYLAGITGITYEGNSIEESPISNSENAKSNHTEELRKKLLAAMIDGRKRLHFANNKGYINNAVFEAVTTAEQYSDRLLGRNDILTFDNEIDFSLSGNVGVGYTPDFANRARFIRLHLDVEDANSRSFDNPDLHNWVKKNRGLILSALYALVRNWMEKGKPLGTVKFASFSQWASICGGIMECAEYESPCNQDKELLALGGDSETQDMKQLFEICYNKYFDRWINKNQIKELVMKNDCNLFSYFDFSQKSDQTKFGLKVSKFVGRVLSEIRLVVKDPNVRPARQQLKFTKDPIETDKTLIFGENYEKITKKVVTSKKNTEGMGTFGNVAIPSKPGWGVILYSGGEKLPIVTRLPKTLDNVIFEYFKIEHQNIYYNQKSLEISLDIINDVGLMINDLTERLGKTIPIQEIMSEINNKYSEEEIMKSIDKLKAAGLIFEPRKNYIQNLN
jgi:hypothetical protein